MDSNGKWIRDNAFVQTASGVTFGIEPVVSHRGAIHAFIVKHCIDVIATPSKLPYAVLPESLFNPISNTPFASESEGSDAWQRLRLWRSDVIWSIARQQHALCRPSRIPTYSHSAVATRPSHQSHKDPTRIKLTPGNVFAFGGLT